MGNASGFRPTTVVSKTEVGEAPSDKEIRATVACVLRRFPTKTVETAADMTDEGVRLLKNQKRTLSVPTMVALARSRGELGPAMWKAICALCGRSDGNPELQSVEMSAAFGALQMLTRTPGPAGEFARAMVAQMNAASAPQDEVAPLKPCDVYEENILAELRERRQRIAEEKRLNLKLFERQA